MFTAIDSSFDNDFTNLLIQDICNLTASQFIPWQVDYCNNGTHFKTLSYGVNSGMNLMDRKTMQAYITLKANSSANATEYFTQNVYQDLDDYQYYMFRIYQATQTRMFKTMTDSIEKHGNTFNTYSYVAICIVIFIDIFWIFDLKKKK